MALATQVGYVAAVVLAGFIALLISRLVLQHLRWLRVPSFDKFIQKAGWEPTEIRCPRCNGRHFETCGATGAEDSRRIHHCVRCGQRIFRSRYGS